MPRNLAVRPLLAALVLVIFGLVPDLAWRAWLSWLNYRPAHFVISGLLSVRHTC